MPKGSRTAAWPGVVVEQRVTPLARVGCYVPGGRYPLPSSLLMTAIPARVAGVGEVIACCPRPEPAVLAAALEAGVSRLYRIGGAHAVAAMAYGTASVPRVDKIVGPGNAWVAAAKALVARDCGIDFFAGPSEIVIVSDTGRADWIAADLVAQAEHDPDARAVLITSSKRLANAVRARRDRAGARRTRPAQASLAKRGGIIVTRSVAQSIEIATTMAPGAPRRRHRGDRRAHPDRRRDVRRAVVGAGGRRLRHRLEPRAADERRGPLPRRPVRRRLRPRLQRADAVAGRAAPPGADGDRAGRRRGPRGARRVDPDPGRVDRRQRER